MSNIAISEEFLAKAKTAKSFEELRSLVAAEGVEVSDDEHMAKWDEFSDGAKKFKLSQEELENVAGGCSDVPKYNGHPMVASYWAPTCHGKWKGTMPTRCDMCGGFVPIEKRRIDGTYYDGYCNYQ